MRRRNLAAVIILSILIIGAAHYYLRALPIDPNLSSFSVNGNTSIVIFTLPNNTVLKLATIHLINSSCDDYGIEAQCEAVMNLSTNDYNINLLKSMGYHIPPINSSSFFNYTGTKPDSTFIAQPVMKTVKLNQTVQKTVNQKANSSYVQDYLKNKGYFYNGSIMKIDIANGSNYTFPFLSQR